MSLPTILSSTAIFGDATDAVMLEHQLRAALDRRRQNGTLRRLTRYETVLGPEDPAIAKAATQAESSQLRAVDTRPLLDFSSNDYIGLAQSDELKDRFLERLREGRRNPVGSTGSRLLDGNSLEHEQLEQRLATALNAPSALLFNSGYDANSSMLSVLPQPSDFIVHDSLIHASAHDGMRASRTAADRRIAFQHNDMIHLASILDSIVADPLNRDANVFIVVESVYSMDGDLCPLRRVVEIANSVLARERRCLIVDEAHAVGLYGLNGAGLADEVGVCSEFDIRLATFGKAFGCSGAAVLCSPLVRTFLINYARPLIYSTAIPHTTLVAIHSALDILTTPQGALRAIKTFSLTQALLDGVRKLLENRTGSDMSLAPEARRSQGLHITLPHAPIVPLIVSNPKQLAAFLIQAGFVVRPIMYPTVPKGSERVRICIHSHNSVDDVNALLRNLDGWLSLSQDQGKSKL